MDWKVVLCLILAVRAEKGNLLRLVFFTRCVFQCFLTTDYHFHTRLDEGPSIIESAWNCGTKKALEITQTLCVSLKFRFGFKPKSDYGARQKKNSRIHICIQSFYVEIDPPKAVNFRIGWRFCCQGFPRQVGPWPGAESGESVRAFGSRIWNYNRNF